MLQARECLSVDQLTVLLSHFSDFGASLAIISLSCLLFGSVISINNEAFPQINPFFFHGWIRLQSI